MELIWYILERAVYMLFGGCIMAVHIYFKCDKKEKLNRKAVEENMRLYRATRVK
jgi:hypothetical protein